MLANKIKRTFRDNNIVISTIEPNFMAWYGKYETAISFDNGKTWHIAEGYENEDEAVKGHEKYSKMSEVSLSEIMYIG